MGANLPPVVNVDAAVRRYARQKGKRPEDVNVQAAINSYEVTLRASREGKRRRTGTCRVCGATTRYNGRTTSGASDLCPLHAAQESGRERREAMETTVAALAYLSEPRRARDVGKHLGIDWAGQLLHRLAGYGLVRRVRRGVYVRVDE